MLSKDQILLIFYIFSHPLAYHYYSLYLLSLFISHVLFRAGITTKCCGVAVAADASGLCQARSDSGWDLLEIGSGFVLVCGCNFFLMGLCLFEICDGGWCYCLDFCGFLSFRWTEICGLGDGGFGLRWVVVDGLWFAGRRNCLLIFIFYFVYTKAFCLFVRLKET